MPPELTLETVHEAVKDMRKELKERPSDVLGKEKVEQINLVLDSWEETQTEVKAIQGIRENHDAAVAELTELKTARATDIEGAVELKQQIHDLELEVARGANLPGVTDFHDTDEYKSLNEFCRTGMDSLTPEQKAVLRTDTAQQGGVLTTTELDTDLQKKITEIDGIRGVSRVRTTSAKSMDIAIRNTIPTATYEGETETSEESNSTYQKENVVPFRQTFTVPITHDMLMDGAFDMNAEIASDANEAFAFGEGNGFVAGTGFKQPAGFTVNATLQTAARDTAAASTIAASDVILLTGDLKVGYNPVYILNRGVLAFLRTLQSSAGGFLWQPGMNGPVANTINGFPYVVANSMPPMVDNAFPIAFGDFRRGYTIVDRTGMSVIRDDYTRKKEGIVEFTMNRWNTGQVTLPEAIKLLKVIP